MKRTLILTLLIVIGVSAGEALDTDAFQYRRSVKTEITGEGLGTIELDRDIFSRTEDYFQDLRLFQESDGTAVEVPFVVTRVPDVRPGSSAVKIPSEVLSFSELENGDVEIRVELRQKKGDAAMLEFRTPLRNFEKSVSVSGVADGGGVEELVSGRLIFDYESFLDFRRTTIVLPPNSYREFVVRVSRATDRQRSAVKQLTRTISPGAGTTIQQSESVETRQFRIDALSFYTERVPREESLSIRAGRLEILEVNEDPEKKVTEILFQGDRVPVDSLVFQTADRNFKRRVELQVPVDVEEELWRTIHTGSIHRYDLGGIQDEDLTLSFSEQRSGLFRLLIHNRDSPPVGIETIVGVGEIYELRFIAASRNDADDSEYVLYFGGGAPIERPDYDVAAIEAAVSGGIERVKLELAPIEENAGFKLIPVKGRGWNQPWILWIAIGIAVSGLSLVLFKTAGHVDQITG